MKFCRHDLEKRSGGSPVIVFHHRRPVCSSSPQPPRAVSPPPTLYIGGGTDARTSIFQCPVRRMPLFLSFLLLLLLFSRSFASVGFPRSWLCHLVPDGRSFVRSLSPSTLNPGRSPGSSIMVLSAPLGPAHAENEATLLFSERTICPPVLIEKL